MSDPLPPSDTPPPVWNCRECGAEFDPYWHDANQRPHCSIECARAERLRGQEEYRAAHPPRATPVPVPDTCAAPTVTPSGRIEIHPFCMNQPKYPDGHCWQHSTAPAAVTRRRRVASRRKLHTFSSDRSPWSLAMYLGGRTAEHRAILRLYAEAVDTALDGPGWDHLGAADWTSPLPDPSPHRPYLGPPSPDPAPDHPAPTRTPDPAPTTPTP